MCPRQKHIQRWAKRKYADDRLHRASHADADLGETEASGFRGNAYVATDGLCKPQSQGVTLYRGDHRLVDLWPGRPARQWPAGVKPPRSLFDIATHAEHLVASSSADG